MVRKDTWEDEFPYDIDEVNRVFGAVIHERRTALGLRLIDLQIAGGPDRSHIGKIENGRVQVSLIGILALAHGLEVSPSDLISEVWQRLSSSR